jgi:ribosomal protein L29
MKKQNLQNLSAAELQELSTSLAKEVFVLRSTLSVQRKLDKPHLLKAKRKERARVLTQLTKKEQAAV